MSPLLPAAPSKQTFRMGRRLRKAFEGETMYLYVTTQYLTTPPVLAKPEEGETMYLYVSVTGSAVSGVLIREERGKQKPIFYISKTLDDAESRYPTLEKLALAVVTATRKLRPYFQSHSISVMTTQPLRNILHSPSQSGKMAKWAVELANTT